MIFMKALAEQLQYFSFLSRFHGNTLHIIKSFTALRPRRRAAGVAVLGFQYENMAPASLQMGLRWRKRSSRAVSGLRVLSASPAGAGAETQQGWWSWWGSAQLGQDGPGLPLLLAAVLPPHSGRHTRLGPRPTPAPSHMLSGRTRCLRVL